MELLDAGLRGEVVGVAAGQLDAALARALLRCGRTEEAATFVSVLGDTAVARVVRARQALAERRYSEVSACVGDLDTLPPIERVEGLVLLSLAATGREAERTITSALELAEPCGIRAPFLCEGEELDRLLDRVDVASIAPGLAQLRNERSAVRSVPDVQLVEPLTDREREVLQLLTTHLTYSGIADATFVSSNTVKTHVKAVYRKLGAVSRSDAVSLGRVAGLIA